MAPAVESRYTFTGGAANARSERVQRTDWVRFKEELRELRAISTLESLRLDMKKRYSFQPS